MTLKSMPGAVAQIEWEDDAKGRVTELVVFDRTQATEREQARYERRFTNSHGACIGDWMNGNRARSTPEGVFALWARPEFGDDERLLSILDQLGQIQEAGWARTMAQAIRDVAWQESGGEPEDRPEPAFYERPLDETA